MRNDVKRRKANETITTMLKPIFHTYVRLGFCCLYLALFSVAPLLILFGVAGGAIGLLLLVISLSTLRYRAEEKILLKLNARILSKIENPVLHHLAAEQARRYGIPPPRLCLLSSDSPNMASFGFSQSRSYLVVTSGLLKSVNRRQLSGLVARGLADVWHPHSLCRAWLARLLSLFDRPVFQSHPLTSGGRKFHSFNTFVLQALIYPLNVLPILILSRGVSASFLDDISSRVSQLPRDLSESLRLLSSQRTLIPLVCNLSVCHLFLVQPVPKHPVAQLLIEEPSLLPRVRIIESRFTLTVPA